MYIKLLFLILFSNAGICLSQQCLDSILLRAPYYNTNDIINGRKWFYEKKYSGNPLLTGDYWPEASISYKGVVYKEILMNFDVYRNEMIVFYPEKGKEKYVVLFADYLSGFSFSDSVLNRERSFEFIELPGAGGKALYENASSGKITLYIKPIKNIVVGSAVKSRGTFENLYEYYINCGNGYCGFHSKKQLIKHLGSLGSEANRFIKKNRLKISNQHPEGVIAVINYLNGSD